MFRQRVIITLIAGPLAIFLIILGGWFYFVPLAIVLLLATMELANMLRQLGWRPFVPLMLLAVLALLLIAQVPAWQQAWAPTLVLSFFLALVYALWLYEKGGSDTAAADWLTMGAAILFIGGVGGHFFLIRQLDPYGVWALLAIVANWSSDSGAYLVGRSLGRHKLSPRLSPNKTIEGYMGGVLVSIVVTVVIILLLNNFVTAVDSFPLVYAIGIVLLAGALSPAGDLGISLLKRESGMKDSGKLFPGHGGALDRVDSLIWAVAFVYYFALLVT